MIRGINFLIPSCTGTFLSSVLKNINFNGYLFEVVFSEVLDGDDYNKFLFLESDDEKLILSDSEFKKESEKYSYVIFMDLHVLPESGEFKELEIYNDFLNSDYQLILLIADNRFVEIYCKNKEWLDIIKKNAENNNFQDIILIDENNDFRTRLSVW